MICKQISALALLALLGSAQNAGAITILSGDVDGFGFTSPNDYENAQNGDPDTDGDGLIEAGEFLPDLDNDGHVQYYGNDQFDNREADERSSTVGAQWTDISLEDYYNYPGAGWFGDSPADDVVFTFLFDVPEVGDADYGLNHFINFIFGDYDVYPASIVVDGTTVGLTQQEGNQDGLVQLAYADVAWSSMLDGQVTIDLNAPNEPYVTIDYAYLHTEAQAAPPSIPEPSTIMLMGAGLIGLGFSRRKARR